MLRLTRQERTVLALALLLLLTGWAVKTYRTAYPLDGSLSPPEEQRDAHGQL